MKRIHQVLAKLRFKLTAVKMANSITFELLVQAVASLEF